MCAQAQAFLSSENDDEALSLHTQIKNIMTTHESILSSQSSDVIATTITELQQRLSCSPKHTPDSSYENVEQSPTTLEPVTISITVAEKAHPQEELSSNATAMTSLQANSFFTPQPTTVTSNKQQTTLRLML